MSLGDRGLWDDGSIPGLMVVPAAGVEHKTLCKRTVTMYGRKDVARLWPVFSIGMRTSPTQGNLTALRGSPSHLQSPRQ
jgi:hypothetical protein